KPGPPFQLGQIQDSAETITQNFQAFLDWLDTVHEPYAQAQDLPACTVCWQHLEALPQPDFVATA
ncbi:MAG: hypothetical protein HC922_08120, partial [Leptolyngbyaceae cyanobacterium SM2_3_12]|nr:hypothetical protein [Leptolyngbyaceae cyanobacterium SM2_3_12]